MTNVEIKDLEKLYQKYCDWCASNGLFPNGLSVEFFDWMNSNE